MSKAMSSALTSFVALALAGCGRGAPQSPKTFAPQAVAPATAPAMSASSAVATAVNANLETLDASILAAAEPTGQPCSLDTIDGNYAKRVTVASGKSHVFRGWVLDASRRPAGRFDLVLEGSQDYVISMITGVKRPDVGEYLKAAALAQAGFESASPKLVVHNGEYKLELFIERGASVWVCDTGKTLVVN